MIRFVRGDETGAGRDHSDGIAESAIRLEICDDSHGGTEARSGLLTFGWLQAAKFAEIPMRQAAIEGASQQLVT